MKCCKNCKFEKVPGTMEPCKSCIFESYPNWLPNGITALEQRVEALEQSTHVHKEVEPTTPQPELVWLEYPANIPNGVGRYVVIESNNSVRVNYAAAYGIVGWGDVTHFIDIRLPELP